MICWKPAWRKKPYLSHAEYHRKHIMALTFPAGYKSANPQAAKRTEEFFDLALHVNVNTPDVDFDLTRLVAQGICLEARDHHGYTALILAAEEGHTATTQALLAAGAEIEARDKFGRTALFEAGRGGHTDTAQALLEAGAEIEVRDKFGYTALICAVWNRHPVTAKALLARGANIYARPNDGNRPIDDPKLSSQVQLLQQGYAEFVASKTPPENTAAVYRLLAATPLLDDKAPVDRLGNLTRIMAHAQWEDKTKPADILSEMAADGSITPEMARSIYQHHIATPLARRTPTPNAGRGR